MREQTCCFTGHRHIPEADREKIKHRLETVITSLYQRGVYYYGAGGALGFDTLAAQAVLRLRERYPALKLILVLPCLDQTKGWRPEDIAVYNQIKAGADKVVYTSQTYTPGCMHKRNRYLVDNSGTCVCYLTKQTGGTAYTVQYAKSHGLDIIDLSK